MTDLKVTIVGAGIGGLCLAHGLRRAGIAVSVYERTQTRTDWLQGYRIHINPHGARALKACLPPEAWQTFLDTVSVDNGGFGFTTEHLVDLLRFGAEEVSVAGRHYGVSRISLREVLLSGLDDVVRLGREFTHYETGTDGRVTAHFATGEPATADLLIGADGANSRVRQQLLPHARRVDTGVVAIAGKYPLDGAALPDRLTHDANLVIPAGPGSFFTAVWRPDRRMVAAPAGAPADFRLDNDRAYLLWGYSATAGSLPRPVEELSEVDLRELVLDRTAGWAPALRDLVAGSDPATINAIRVRSATPVKPWPTGPVTLLGDAIHNMTPAAGIGANTALRDAELLARQLTAVAAGTVERSPAVAGYEAQMLEYGFAAVKLSLRNARQGASGSRVARAMFRTTLRTINAVPFLRRRMAASFGQ